MLLLLTLPYIALLVLLVKKKILKPTIWVKLSPLAWLLFLFLALFIPMNSYAPAGDVRVFSAVIPIVPRVAGRVTEVPVKPNVKVRKGEVLFKIDPRPYQYQVDKLEAALAAANTTTAQLAEKLKGAEAATKQAKASLGASESDFDLQARENLEGAGAKVREAEANLNHARANLRRAEELDAANAIAKNQLDDARRQVKTMQATLESAQSAEKKARNEISAGGDRLASVREQVAQADSREKEARLAYEAEIGGENPQVRQIAADLANARWQVEESVVYAPDDGYVTNMALRPGATVASLPLSPAMAFVTSEKALGMFVKQTNSRYIEPGQEAEVTMDLYPGRIFHARVVDIVQGTRQGQVQISGSLASEVPQRRAPFMLRLEPEGDLSEIWLPPGSGGAATVYTGKGKITYVIRRVLMHVYSWMNYMR